MQPRSFEDHDFEKRDTTVQTMKILTIACVLLLACVVHAKDFYKLLGVKRNAQDSEIKKAYR